MKTTSYFLNQKRWVYSTLAGFTLVCCLSVAGIKASPNALLKAAPSESASLPITCEKAFASNNVVYRPDERVDFQVQSVSRHRFQISFNNRSGRSIFVKIYDVIGNLIRHENIDRKGKFKKEYDLSDAPTDFYVIEVGDRQSSTVKRLFPN